MCHQYDNHEYFVDIVTDFQKWDTANWLTSVVNDASIQEPITALLGKN